MSAQQQAQIRTELTKIASRATDGRVTDKAFRRMVLKTLPQLGVSVDTGKVNGKSARNAAGVSVPLRTNYVFVAVPNGNNGTTSVSIRPDLFEQLAERLGGRSAVTTLARTFSQAFNPDSGVTRSHYVRSRLEKRAATAADKAAAAAPRAGSSKPRAAKPTAKKASARTSRAGTAGRGAQLH